MSTVLSPLHFTFTLQPDSSPVTHNAPVARHCSYGNQQKGIPMKLNKPVSTPLSASAPDPAGNCGGRTPLVLALVAAGALASALQGCNTTEGVGRDIEAAGEALSDTAEDASD